MKSREVILFNGARFKVPQCIQRIDHRSTHGWQLRYGGTKFFRDGSQDGTGAKAALARATKELLHRIATLPAPAPLQRAPSQNKTSDLPAGISGPIVSRRKDSKVLQSSLLVLVPRFGDTPKRRTIYIGSEKTYTVQRYERAVARAIKMRKVAEAEYRRDATQARRAEASQHVARTTARTAARAASRATSK
jgi:hypothetical protein